MPATATAPVRVNGGLITPYRSLSTMMRHARANGQDPIAVVRANSPLPEDAQTLIDTVITRDALEELTFVDDLEGAGLVYPLTNWLGVPELYWAAGSEVGTPVRSMSPVTRRENFKPDRTGFRLPIFCTSMEFSVEPREQAVSERVGAPMDTANVEQAIRRENEAIEDSFFYGAEEIVVGGNSVPGVLDAPNRHDHTYTGSEALTAKTGEEIVAEAGIMLGLLADDEQNGPITWYVPPADHLYFATTDYKANSSDTILSRLQAIEAGGSRNLRVRKAARLRQTGQSAMIHMSSSVVQVVKGQAPTHLSWEEGPFDVRHVILACVVPRVRTNYSGQSGIVVGSPS